jgi:hypothetical protein
VGAFDLNVNEGVALIAHLFDSVNFHRKNAKRMRLLMLM